MKTTKRLLISAGFSLGFFASAAPAAAAVVHVVKSPTCGCCTKWVDHLRKAGHIVKVQHADPYSEAKRLGVPDTLRSCHTASVGRYALEGHVPAGDIAKLLREKPNAAGLAVAGMPLGAPGMEHAGQRQPYQTILFSRTGTTRVFASH